MPASRLVTLLGVILFVVAAVSVRVALVLLPEQWALLAFACWLGAPLLA